MFGTIHNCSSRPLPGVLISLQKWLEQHLEYLGSRPLPGVLISLQDEEILKTIKDHVLVPFPGFLYLYGMNFGFIQGVLVLVPFPGFLYLYPVLAIP